MRGLADANQWDRLYDSFSDKDAARRFMAIFLSESRSRLRQFREGLANGDAERVGNVAHALKSPSRWVGAVEVADACVRLEEATRRGADLSTLYCIVEEIERAMQEVQRALTAELGGPLPDPPAVRPSMTPNRFQGGIASF